MPSNQCLCGVLSDLHILQLPSADIILDDDLERSLVTQSFMLAHLEIEKSGRGFGQSYWSSQWKFRIFNGIYSQPDALTQVQIFCDAFCVGGVGDVFVGDLVVLGACVC